MQAGAVLTALLWGLEPQGLMGQQDQDRCWVPRNRAPLLTHVDMCEAAARHDIVATDVDR